MNVRFDGAPRFSNTADGADIGSSMVIVFTEENWKLIVGHSKSDRVWKFPCGKIERQDMTYGMSPDEELPAIARRCVLREFAAEVGLSSQDLLLVHQLEYIRNWKKEDYLTRHKKNLQQFHFVAMMKEGVKLPARVEEEAEMDVRAYWSVEEVLRQTLQPRYSEKKFNPYHAIALVEALLFLQTIIGTDPKFAEFHRILYSLESDRIHLQTLGNELNDLIERRKI